MKKLDIGQNYKTLTSLSSSFRNSIRSDSGSSSSSIRSRVGSGVSKPAPEKVTDVRQILEEKRQGLSQQRTRPPVAPTGKTGKTVLYIHKNIVMLI